ncbi:TPA: PhzF family phenazine biosynthesis protein [Enterobacter hormaechei]
MQEIDFYLVDAFSDRAFGGNAAAVCPLEAWLPDETLLKMAKQHNQSETAFFVRTDNGFELRWFTTQDEINLCGHATLAASRVIFEYLDYPHTEITFTTRFAGELTVQRSGDWLTLNFPAWSTEVVDTPPAVLFSALGINAANEVRVGRDYMVVLDSQRQVEALTPDIAAMLPLGKMVCVTAPGDEYDFVSRFFCPGEGVPEDPVTGSAHSMLIPYWSEKLGKTQMSARQVSLRGGDLRCELKGDRVLIGGQATLYMKGKIFLRLQDYLQH